MKTFVAVLTLFAVLAACTPSRLPGFDAGDSSFVQDEPDGAVQSVHATCDTYCAHAAALHCAEADATPNGASCETVCMNVGVQGILKWNLSCRSTATTCAAIDSCERP